MLRLENVKKSFIEKDTRLDALKGVSYTFPERGLVFLVGRSGCGKSTLLNIMGGLEKPTEGEVFFCDRALSSFTKKEMNAYRASCVGFVFQESNLFASLTVKQNILFGSPETDCEEILRRLGIEELQNRKINELSGGQLQRAAIARALAKDVSILLADEPTGSLDEKTGEEIFALLKEISKDKLVIAVTHDRKCAEYYGDEVLTLSDGSLANAGKRTGDDFHGTETNSFVRTNELLSQKTAFPLALKTGISLIFANKLRAAFAVLFSVLAFLCFTAIFECKATEDYKIYGKYFADYIEEYPYLFVSSADGAQTDGLTNTDYVLYRQGQIYAKDAAQAERFSFAPQTRLVPLAEDVFYINVGPLGKEMDEAEPLCAYGIVSRHEFGLDFSEIVYDAVIVDGEEIPFKDSGMTVEECIGLPVKLYSLFLSAAGEKDEVPVYRFGGLVKSDWYNASASKVDYVKYVFGERELLQGASAIVRTESIADLPQFFTEYGLGDRTAADFFDCEGKMEWGFTQDCFKAIKSVERAEPYMWIFAAVAGLIYLVLVLNVITVSVQGNRRQVALMRALGVPQSKIFLSFLCGVFILVAPALLASFALSAPMCLLFNALLGVSHRGHVVQIVLLNAGAFYYPAAIAIGVCAVAFLLTVLLLIRLNLAEAIRREK